MATQTTYYKLTKPASGDYYNIDDFNQNSDKLDTALKELSERADTALAGIPELRRQIYKQAGSFTFTAPKTTSYIVECVGGGGGCTSRYSITGGYTGGGGAYVMQKVSLAAGQNVTVTVGGAGAIASSGNATAGGASSFGSLATAPGGRTDVTVTTQNNMPGAGDIRLPGRPAYYDAGSANSYPMGFSGSSMYGTPTTFVMGSSEIYGIGQYGEGAGVGAVYLAATGLNRPASPGLVIITWVS